MRPATILSSALLLAATSSAWPSMLSNPVDALKREIAPFLIERQDDSSSSAASSGRSSEVEDTSASRTGDSSASRTRSSASVTATSDEDDENGDETSSSGSAKTTGTGKDSGSKTASVTGKESGSDKDSGSKTSSNSTTTAFDPRLPAGGASMITPDAMSPASYYKIKDQITFAWNYTSLSKPPKAIDVLATCSANSGLYTIAANETWEQMQTVIWDTGKYQATGTVPLLTETYTLIIHDAQRDVSATAPAGYLGAWKQFSFGMYEPQEYTPMADYVCATCSAAMSLSERQTLGFLFSMVGVTVLTFGWFTGAAGLW